MFRLEHSDNYEQHLLPGDIVFKYERKNPDLVAKIIKLGQKIRETVDSRSVDYTHAGVYVGEKKIAEAGHTPLGDLVLQSTKGSWTLSDELHIFRLKDQEMAKNLSSVTKSIIKKDKEEKSGSYSFTKAIFSALSSKRDSKKKLKSYLKAGYYVQTGIKPMKNEKHRDFFCSYLVSWALQGAEASKAIAEFNKLNKEKITFPDLSKIPEEQQYKELGKWAKETIKKFGRQLEDLIDIDLDAKTTSPARLHDFIVTHPHLFEEVGVVYTPTKHQ